MTSSAFGVDFYTEDKCLLLDELFQHKKGDFRYVVTPNINHIVLLDTDNELKHAYVDADKRICDSRILQPVLRFLGVKIIEVIPGSDLTSDVFEGANKRCLAITIIGSEASEIEVLRVKYPNIRISHHNPSYGFINKNDEVGECISFVVSHPSDFVIFAVGCPRQEVLAHLVLRNGGAVGVGLCVGASISFISGRMSRAPKVLQVLRLEWVYRAFQEPKRLGSRYLKDMVRIIPLLFKELKG